MQRTPEESSTTGFQTSVRFLACARGDRRLICAADNRMCVTHTVLQLDVRDAEMEPKFATMESLTQQMQREHVAPILMS